MIEKYWNAGFLARLFGAVFVFIGVTGFLPNPLYSEVGFFAANAAHNLVHVLTGLAFLGGAYAGRPLLTIRAVAALYVVVAVLGFVSSGDMLLWIVHINEADRWLHAALAATFIALGTALPRELGSFPAHA